METGCLSSIWSPLEFFVGNNDLGLLLHPHDPTPLAFTHIDISEPLSITSQEYNLFHYNRGLPVSARLISLMAVKSDLVGSQRAQLQS
jgi:hypothetical protein